MNLKISQHVINTKIINKIVYILLFIPHLQSLVCVLHLQHISFQASTFQGPGSHPWLVAQLGPPSPNLPFPDSLTPQALGEFAGPS